VELIQKTILKNTSTNTIIQPTFCAQINSALQLNNLSLTRLPRVVNCIRLHYSFITWFHLFVKWVRSFSLFVVADCKSVCAKRWLLCQWRHKSIRLSVIHTYIHTYIYLNQTTRIHIQRTHTHKRQTETEKYRPTMHEQSWFCLLSCVSDITAAMNVKCSPKQWTSNLFLRSILGIDAGCHY